METSLKFFNFDEAKEILGVDRSTLEAMMDKREIGYRIFANDYHFMIADLENAGVIISKEC